MGLLAWFRDQLQSPPMNLRCKPGDIARITQAGPNQDRMVTVMRADQSTPGCWIVRALQEVYAFKACVHVAPGTVGICGDRHLQPMRDRPGEDESLRWLDVPRDGVRVFGLAAVKSL